MSLMLSDQLQQRADSTPTAHLYEHPDEYGEDLDSQEHPVLLRGGETHTTVGLGCTVGASWMCGTDNESEAGSQRSRERIHFRS
jgi:hypothetical protein